jgi:hypothetical protein
MPTIRADDQHGVPLQRVLNFVGDLLEIYSTRYRATVPYSPAIPSQSSVHLHGRPPTRRRKRVVRRQSNCDGHHENVDWVLPVNRFTGVTRAVTLNVAAPALDDRAGQIKEKCNDCEERSAPLVPGRTLPRRTRCGVWRLVPRFRLLQSNGRRCCRCGQVGVGQTHLLSP